MNNNFSDWCVHASNECASTSVCSLRVNVQLWCVVYAVVRRSFAYASALHALDMCVCLYVLWLCLLFLVVDQSVSLNVCC